ncbi:DUF61 family protein [[Eubacterium] cellulosolvens]|jgi:uncharacterized protein (UPF0216 family)
MSESQIEKIFGAMIEEEVRSLNYHLPKTRKPLKILLKEETPSVETQDGRSILMKKEEIAKLSEIVPSHLQDKIQLPIIIQRRFDLGKSIYTVIGNRLEEFTLKKALELNDHDFTEYEKEEPFHIFKPYLSELIRMFHTLIVIGFGKPESLSEL